MRKNKKAPTTHLGGATDDSYGAIVTARFRGIDSRGAAPAEPGRRWEANYKLKLGQALASRVPLGAAGGRELRRGENKECLAVFGSMMTGALVQVQLEVHHGTGTLENSVAACHPLNLSYGPLLCRPGQGVKK